MSKFLRVGRRCRPDTGETIWVRIDTIRNITLPWRSDVRFNRAAAAGALTAIAAIGLIGKIIFGFVSERISARPSFILTLAIQATGLALFIFAGDSQLIWLAVVVFGVGFGGMGVLNALIVSEAFGIRAFGSIMGLVTLAGTIPHLVGPVVAGSGSP